MSFMHLCFLGNFCLVPFMLTMDKVQLFHRRVKLALTRFLALGILLLTLNATSVVSLKSSHYSESVIDLNHLIIIQDNFTEAGVQSLFGFSHVLLDFYDIRPNAGISNAEHEAWILIGAPKGNSSDRDYREISEPGVIWRCSLKKNLTNNNCKILFIDPIISQIGKADCRPTTCPAEKRDHSALGFTIVANKNRIVTCAPQWQRQIAKNSDEYKMNGICYWLPKSIVLAEEFSMNSMISSGFRSQRLFPLLDKHEQVRMNYPLLAWGQTGFSAHLTSSNDLYLGAPGVNGWNGTIVKYQDYKATSQFKTRPRPNNKNGTQTEFAQFLILQTHFIQYYLHLEYFGYAISSGKYFQTHYTVENDEEIDEMVENSRTFIASSAPRGGRHYGLVVIYEFPIEETYFWLPTVVLEGTQFGAYFGSSLVSVDLNGDGFDELLIGAPLQRNEAEDDVIETGCVFIYSAKSLKFKFTRPELICGKFKGSKFGTSLAKLGDLNRDGFQDFAVGAPEEIDDDSQGEEGDLGFGAVYIYFGSNGFGLKDSGNLEYAMRLTPKKFGLPYLGGFGIHISGDVDIDGNGSKDFAVGAHLSKTVIIFRTRRVSNFEGHIDLFTDNPKNLNVFPSGSPPTFLSILPIDSTYFIIRSCLRIKEEMLNSDGSTFPLDAVFDVTIKLTVDGEFKRFRILEPATMPETTEFELISNGSIVLYNTKVYARRDEINSNCAEWIVLHNQAFPNPNDINPKPLRISQELRYKEENIHNKRSPQIRTIIKNERKVPELVINNVEDEFCSYCPPETQLMTEIRIPIASDNCDDDGNPICSPNIKVLVNFIKGQIQSQDEISDIIGPGEAFVIGSAKVLTVQFQIENTGESSETAYFPSIHLSWSNPVIFPLLNFVTDTIYDCQLKSKTELQCELGDTFQPNESRIISVSFSLAELYARAESGQLTFTAEIFALVDKSWIKNTVEQSSSESITSDLKIQLNKLQQTLQLKSEVTELKFDSSIENATFSNEDQAFTKIIQIYTLELFGQSPIDSIYFDFWFPVKYSSNVEVELVDANEEMISIGPPKGNGCRLITANTSFFIDPKEQESSFNVTRRQIFSTPDDNDEDINDEYTPLWVLPSSGFVGTTHKSEILEKSNETRVSTNARTKPFESFSEGSRHFLEQFHPNQLLRCINEDDETCVQIACEMKRIVPNHRLQIKFPLYIKNEIARQIFLHNTKSKRKSSGRLLIQSLGRVKLFSNNITKEMKMDNKLIKMASFVTLVSSSFEYYSRENFQRTASIDILWIYLISILIGLLILIVIVYILVKCGFFRRQKPFPGWKPLNPMNNERVGDPLA